MRRCCAAFFFGPLNTPNHAKNFGTEIIRLFVSFVCFVGSKKSSQKNKISSYRRTGQSGSFPDVTDVTAIFLGNDTVTISQRMRRKEEGPRMTRITRNADRTVPERLRKIRVDSRDSRADLILNPKSDASATADVVEFAILPTKYTKRR